MALESYVRQPPSPSGGLRVPRGITRVAACWLAVLLGFLALSSAACSSHRAAPKSPAAAARVAFFEALLARTLELDPRTKKRRTALEATRARFEDAHDDTELFRALCAFDAARGRGGLAPLPKQAEAEATPAPSELPLRFEAERSGDGRWHYFVCDLPFDAHYYLPDSRPEVGDVVVGLHGLSVDAWVTRARGLVCDSTEAATHAEVARAMSRRTPTWPTELVPDEPSLRLRRKDGREVDIPIAWTKRPVEQWLRVDDPYYDGFSRVLTTKSFDVHAYAGSAAVLAIDCHEFDEALEADLAQLLAFAERESLLDHDLILDFTHCRGGAHGAKLLVHVFNAPLLALDIEVATETVQAAEASWRETIPKAPRLRFRGRAACLFGPSGDASVDRIATMVLDQRLAQGIGRATRGRGCAKALRDEVVSPISGRAFASFAWSVAETLRGDGTRLEGNPPRPAIEVAPTHENIRDYHRLLVDRAMEALGHR